MPRRPRPRSTISDQLRDVIQSRGTAYATAKAAGVDPGVVSRFMNPDPRKRRSITTDTFDRIAEALGLRLVELGKRGPKPGRRDPSPEALEAEPPPLDGVPAETITDGGNSGPAAPAAEQWKISEGADVS